MKIELESTDKVVTLNGMPARLWQGKTTSGIECHALIPLIAADKDADLKEFERDLVERSAPRPEYEVYPMRLLL